VLRDNWDGLVGAWRWWHVEGGLVIYGMLVSWRSKQGMARLHVHIPDGDLTLAIRGEGISRLTIETEQGDVSVST
jgi:hypothetical protein